MRLVVLLAALIHCVPAYDVDVKKLEGLARARVEVESGHRPAYVYCIYIYDERNAKTRRVPLLF